MLGVPVHALVGRLRGRRQDGAGIAGRSVPPLLPSGSLPVKGEGISAILVSPPPPFQFLHQLVSVGYRGGGGGVSWKPSWLEFSGSLL